MRLFIRILLLVIAPALYCASASAQSSLIPARPLVFIPGIIGSQLWSGDERVWGGLNDIVHINRLLISGNIRESAPLSTCSSKEIKNISVRSSCGAVDNFTILPPFAVDQYSTLFDYLETIGYHRSGPKKNLYIFSYDWRQSNFETARLFKLFIESQDRLAGIQFDILAHSMGGLVALIYTNRYDAPKEGQTCRTNNTICRVQTVITLGTPFFGSMSAIRTADVGWGDPWNWIAGGKNTVAKTILSWPSLYELLPTYDRCCYTADADGKLRALNVARFEDWRMLPFASVSPLSELDIREALTGALQIKALAENGFPPYLISRAGPCDTTGNRVYTVAGDHYPTPATFVLANGQLVYSDRRGDETVLLRSAAMGDVGRSSVSFVSHRKIFADRNIQSQLRRILLRCDLNFEDYSLDALSIELELSRGGQSVAAPIYTIGVRLNPDVPQAGQSVHAVANLDVETFQDVIPPAAELTISANNKILYYGKDIAGRKETSADPARTHFVYEFSKSDCS